MLFERLLRGKLNLGAFLVVSWGNSCGLLMVMPFESAHTKRKSHWRQSSLSKSYMTRFIVHLLQSALAQGYGVDPSVIC